MKHTSPQVDAYVSAAAAFAQPILRKIRTLFHRACPDIQETMKWNFPHFEHQGIVGSMAAFKKHVSFGFWKGSLLAESHPLFTGVGSTSMSALKITSLDELPEDVVLLDAMRAAVAFNEQGVKVPKPKKKPDKKDLAVPDYFLAALGKNKRALATFEGFSYSNKKEYVEWITEAKQAETRTKRLATALEWLAEGKTKNWKYKNR